MVNWKEMVLPKISNMDVCDAHYIKWPIINRTNNAHQPEAAFVLFMHQNRGLFSANCQLPSGGGAVGCCKLFYPLARCVPTICQKQPSLMMHGALIQTSAIWVFHHHRHTCNYSFCRSNIKYSPIEGDPHPLPCFSCTVSSSFITVKLVTIVCLKCFKWHQKPFRIGREMQGNIKIAGSESYVI